MGWRVGAQGGGMTDSLNMPDARLVEKAQMEKVALLVAAAKNRPRPMAKEEDNILRQIQAERARQAKRQAAWQREAAQHRAKIDALIRKLEVIRTGAAPAMGSFGAAFARPRVAGRERAMAMARARSGRSR